MKGVVFDAPSVVGGAQELIAEQGLEARCTAIAGDFFESVPTGGDAYVEGALFFEVGPGRLFLRGTANEILTYRSNPDEAQAVTQEGIDLILHAWTEPQPFGWEGRYFNYRTVSVWPRTVQDPHPPVFSSGNSPESVQFCASRRLNLALSFIRLPDIKQRVALYQEAAAKEGWEPTAENVLYRFWAHVAESDEAAERNTSRFKVQMGLTRHMSRAVTQSLRESPPEKLEFDRPFLCGGSATVVDQIGALREAGVGAMDIAFVWPGLSYQQQLESMERFASDVLPHIRDL